VRLQQVHFTGAASSEESSRLFSLRGHRRSVTESRRAYTAASMPLLTDSEARLQAPAGACWIDRDAAMPDVRTVRWSEMGSDYSARLSADDTLRSNLHIVDGVLSVTRRAWGLRSRAAERALDEMGGE
jgi:hypothetical protein